MKKIKATVTDSTMLVSQQQVKTTESMTAVV